MLALNKTENKSGHTAPFSVSGAFNNRPEANFACASSSRVALPPFGFPNRHPDVIFDQLFSQLDSIDCFYSGPGLVPGMKRKAKNMGSTQSSDSIPRKMAKSGTDFEVIPPTSVSN